MIEKARRIIEAGITIFSSTMEARAKLEAVTFCTRGYIEPGYDDPDSGLIAIGEFSAVTVSPISAARLLDSLPTQVVDDAPERVAYLLEELGVELQPEDEWTLCNKCHRAFRTKENSCDWKFYGWDDENGNIICGDCVAANATSYLEWHEDRAYRCLTLPDIDAADHGYVFVESFVHGIHPGQDASARLIAKAVRQQDISRFLFRLDLSSQYNMHFSLFIHETEFPKLDLEVWKSAPKDGPSLSEEDRLAPLDAPDQLNQISTSASWPPRNGTTKLRLHTPAQQQHEESHEPNTD